MLVRIEGIVQGSGSGRSPTRCHPAWVSPGWSATTPPGVFAEVDGDPDDAAAFVARLRRQAPPLASIETITTVPLEPDGATAFVIGASQDGGQRRALVSPDTATCADCLSELGDRPAVRLPPAPRWRASPCARCAPPSTTIPLTWRFHAQPTCCPACGQSLRLLDATGGLAVLSAVRSAGEVPVSHGALAA